MIMFSIVMPVYNVAPFLREAIDSVLSQNYTNWELLCVDDGSNDGSGVILDEYSQQQKQIRVIHQANAGVSAARNAALARAMGEWVVFVDADDVLHSSMLAILNDAICKRHDADIVRVSAETFVDGTQPFLNVNIDSANSSIVNMEHRLEYADLSAMLWGAAYRRSLLPSGGFRPYCRGEDRLYVGEFLSQARCGIRIPIPLYGYRVRLGSAMTTGMNYRKLHDRLGYSYDWLNALIHCDKAIDRLIYHEIGINVTEMYITNLHCLTGSDREQLWSEWHEFLPKISKFMCFTRWTQFVIDINIAMPFWIVAEIFCGIPMRLKKWGLHR